MCGILGSVNIDFTSDLLTFIEHRGPNDEGLMKQVINEDNFVYLAHKRLSIVDLSEAGHQPMLSSDKNFVITFNGEIYNHQELRKVINHIKFNGHSDTETIINYIAVNGIESVSQFNGIFAFACLDNRNKKLYLVRDRFGVKPLYYYWLDNQLLFSSEIRPIKSILNLNLNTKNIAEFLKYGYNPSPNTIFNNLFKLKPGHIAEIDLNTKSLRIKPFIQRKIETNNNLTFNNAEEEYSYLFEQGIKRQMMSDVEIGILLSGGIDSALVTNFAQKYSSNKIKTFTVGFDEYDESNELAEARETSNLLGTEHNEIIINKVDFKNIFEKVNKITEEPLSTTSQIPFYYLLQIVSKYVKVVLTGQGADEPHAGYQRYLGEYYLSKFPSLFFKLLTPFLAHLKNEKLYRSIYSFGNSDVFNRFERIYSLFDTNQIMELTGSNPDENIKENMISLFEQLNLNSKNTLQALLSLDTRMGLSDNLLIYTDKVSMNFSVETRVPILDNDLVIFIETLPLKYKINLGRRKYLHKKFAERILPRKVVYRRKKNFNAPTKRWFSSELGLEYKNLFKNNNNPLSNYLNMRMVDKIFSDHLKQKKNYEKQIFQFISLYNIIK